MPRVDAIGVSSAGVYVNNKIMVASLFLKVNDEDFEKKVKTMYIDVAKELGENIPLEVANDGDVTALAGAIDLNDDSVLGIAMGTSEAVGYINKNGGLNGWLSELAFVPVDYNKDSMVDEWSGDYGCGVKYFSQDSVIKLAEMGGYKFDETLSPAEKLKVVQNMMADGDPLAKKIYEDIGTYLGHTMPYYAMFYGIKHVLLLGRVTSGAGGNVLWTERTRFWRKNIPNLNSESRCRTKRTGEWDRALPPPLLPQQTKRNNCFTGGFCPPVIFYNAILYKEIRKNEGYYNERLR